MFKLKIATVTQLDKRKLDDTRSAEKYVADPASKLLEEQVASLALYLVGVSNTWTSSPYMYLDGHCKVDVVLELDGEDRAIGVQVKSSQYYADMFIEKYANIQRNYPLPGVIVKGHPLVMLQKLAELTRLPIDPAALLAIEHAKLFSGKTIPKVALRGINMYLELGLAQNTGDGLKFP